MSRHSCTCTMKSGGQDQKLGENNVFSIKILYDHYHWHDTAAWWFRLPERPVVGKQRFEGHGRLVCEPAQLHLLERVWLLWDSKATGA